MYPLLPRLAQCPSFRQRKKLFAVHLSPKLHNGLGVESPTFDGIKNPRAYFKLKTQSASFLASASLTWVLAGIATAPQTPEPPFMILLANLVAASF